MFKATDGTRMTTFLFLNLNWLVTISLAGFRKAIKWIQISILQDCWWIIIHMTLFWQILFHNWLNQRQVWIKCLLIGISHLFIKCIEGAVFTFVWLIDPPVCGIYCLMRMQMNVNDNSVIPGIHHWLTATAVLVGCVAIIAVVITVLYGQVMTYAWHARIVGSRYIAWHTSNQYEVQLCIWNRPMRDDVTL